LVPAKPPDRREGGATPNRFRAPPAEYLGVGPFLPPLKIAVFDQLDFFKNRGELEKCADSGWVRILYFRYVNISSMGQDTSLVVSANDVKAFEKLKVISLMAPLKEKIRSLEKKYGCDLPAFEARVKQPPEDFELWDDFIEWKAYSESVKELEDRLKMIEDAKDVRVAQG